MTPKTIGALPAAVGKRYEVRDRLTPGLVLRVSDTGLKVFYACKRVNHKMRRFKIGPYPILSLHDAREKARELLRNIEMGRYVEKAPHEEDQRTPTLAETVPQFIELYAKQRTRDWHGTERVLLKFSSLYSRPVDTIKRADVVRVLDIIVANGTPWRANRPLAAFKKLMNWCIDRGVIEHSPVAQLKMPSKEVARERVLTQDELRICWHTAGLDGYPFGPCVWLLMLTGQRRSEVSEMRWSELDIDNALWTIPKARVKNGTTQVVPLSRLATSIIRSLPRFPGSDYVFTTTGTSPISGFDMSLTKRMEWLRTHVVAPAETLMDALSVENRPHFSDWPGYRFLRRRPNLDELRAELAALRRHARSLYFSISRQLEDGAPHNSEMRYDIVGSLIDLLAEHFPEIPRTRGQYDKALGVTVGRTPDFVRRAYLEITDSNEQLDAPIQAAIEVERKLQRRRR